MLLDWTVTQWMKTAKNIYILQILIIFKYKKLNIIGKGSSNELKYDLAFHMHLMKDKGTFCWKLISPEARITLFLLIGSGKD